ncbi:LysR family transcriptional regulator [Streptomyces sp. SDT5-1]|uniref:LysR family transcriptional regulator n=1 Tax=Streptomyces sp. SDT5-1 TaxID=3406418 RepID=UPI003FD2DDE7
MDVSAHALRYFVALAEEGHMGRAAQRLHLAPPSLSQQITRLERLVRARLFTRTRQGVELTPTGREFLPLARAATQAHETVALWAAAQAAAPPGTVRVGVFAAAADEQRAAAMARMAERHPDVQVTTRRTGIDSALAALHEGSLDVLYLPEPLPPTGPSVRWVTVGRRPRLLGVPSGHRLAGRDAVSIEETNDDVFLILAEAPQSATDWWLVDPRADGSSPARGPRASDFDELLDLCAAGRGLCLAAAAAASHYQRPGVTFVPLSDVEETRTALCWRPDERDPGVRAYVAAAREIGRDGGAPSPGLPTMTEPKAS